MIYLVGILALLLMGSSSGWLVRGHWDAGDIEKVKAEVAQEKAAALAERDAQRKRADDKAAQLEVALSKLRFVNSATNQEVRHETAKAVYSDPNCDLPLSGGLLLNQSIREANRAAGFVSSTVPAAAGPSRQGQPNPARRPIQP